MRHRFSSKGQLFMVNFIRETGRLSPAIFSSFGHLLISNSCRDVRWRSPVQSNISRFDKSNRYRVVREGGSKPSLGKDLMPSHRPQRQRSVSMPMDGHARPLSSFSQLTILTVLRLGGIPRFGKDSISGQLDMRRYSNFGRRLLISSGNDFNLSEPETLKVIKLGAGNPSLQNDTKLGH